MRYGELRKASGKITQKMLTQTLRELEKNTLITIKVYIVIFTLSMKMNNK
jgi:DNA-binding HxlR family transcriptional regulator